MPQRIKGRDINSATNLVLSCPDCNKAKGSRVMKPEKLEVFRKSQVMERQAEQYRDALIRSELDWI